MPEITIDKKGNTKEQLMEKLKGFRKSYSKEIQENNIKFTELDNGYKFNVEKKVIFLNFYVNGAIAAEDERFVIKYETNAPRRKVEEALSVIRKALEDA
jgi:hypothetical protein